LSIADWLWIGDDGLTLEDDDRAFCDAEDDEGVLCAIRNPHSEIRNLRRPPGSR
jgi:hypothetical protein